METTVTMSDIARLANVTRQAVTNWRSRPSSTPFPASVTTSDGIEHFDRDQVVDWLEATGRGHNTDVRLDAPAIAFPGDRDLAARSSSSPCVLRSQRTSGPSLPTSASRTLWLLIRTTRGWPPRCARWRTRTRSPLRRRASEPPTARPTRWSACTPPAPLVVRGLSDDLVSLLQAVADVCRTHLGPDAVAIDLRLETRARKVAASFTSTNSAHRAMARHLVLDGLTLDPRAASVVRVVSAVGRTDSDALQLADETALDLGVGQVAIVVGPASALCDRLRGDCTRIAARRWRSAASWPRSNFLGACGAGAPATPGPVGPTRRYAPARGPGGRRLGHQVDTQEWPRTSLAPSSRPRPRLPLRPRRHVQRRLDPRHGRAAGHRRRHDLALDQRPRTKPSSRPRS